MSLCNVSLKKEWDVDNTRCPRGEKYKNKLRGLDDKSQSVSQSVWVNKRHLSIITKATGVLRSL